MNNIEFKSFITKHDVNIKGVIHVGAHFGQENELYNELGIKNKIFFEPLNSNFSTLVEQIGNEDGTILVKKALGNQKKQIEMFVESSNKGMSSSILEPKLHIRQFPNIVFDKREIVEMDRLDDLEFDYSPYNMMNIDVQGYELEVLKGSINTLKNIDYLVVEINSAELYQGCPLFGDIQKFLESNGLTCIDQFWWGGNFGEGFFKRIK